MGLVLCAYGHPVDETFRFCPHCAAPVAATLSPPKTRAALVPPPPMPSGTIPTVDGTIPPADGTLTPPSNRGGEVASATAEATSVTNEGGHAPQALFPEIPSSRGAQPVPNAAAAALAARTPTTLDAYYRVLRIIADGGMGRILLARERRTGRVVAIKEVAENLRGDELVIRHFLREGMVTARLQHPGIMPIFDLGFIDRGDLYFTMRYVEGRSLRECSRLSRVERLNALRSAMSAVHYAHSQGLWHRDLKPDNVLLGAHGDVYVLDWGLVSVQPGARYRLRLPPIVIDGVLLSLPNDLMEVSEANPKPTGLMGTPPYMAPEQISGDEGAMGSRSDIWAFGIMLYELLTDRHPILGWDEMTPHEIMQRVLTLGEVAPSQVVGGVPPDLDHLCMKMLAPDPTQRLPYLSDAMDLLSFHLRGVDLAPAMPQPSTYRGAPEPAAPAVSVAEVAVDAEASKDATPAAARVAPPVAKTPPQPVAQAETTSSEGVLLRAENDRLRRRVELLTELAQLSGLESSRRAVIVSELLRT
ncbi:MAG: protein kinase [Polyangiaceae bacterium]